MKLFFPSWIFFIHDGNCYLSVFILIHESSHLVLSLFSNEEGEWLDEHLFASANLL